MNCASCGHEVPNGAYCERCGASLVPPSLSSERSFDQDLAAPEDSRSAPRPRRSHWPRVLLVGSGACLLAIAVVVLTTGGTDQGQARRAAAPAPLDVARATHPAVALAAGDSYGCALLHGGAIDCWGDNSSGQLGDGTTRSSERPVRVAGISNAVAISAFSIDTCVVLSDGTVSCWGDNQLGQLGSGATGKQSDVPVPVSGLSDVVQVAVASDHTCARIRDGTVQCWGANEQGQLGSGQTANNVAGKPTESTIPVSVAGITSAVQIASGTDHTCAVLRGGTVECWGANTDGQLGDGTTTERDVPTPIQGVSDVAAIASGATCAPRRRRTRRVLGL